jgi:Hydrogenase 4 membrane component (E)
MSSAYTQVLYAACGVLTLSGIGMVWRRELSALVRLLAVQGAALAVIAAVQAAHTASVELAVVAIVVAAVKAVALPRVLRRVLARDDQPREAAPLVNVTPRCSPRVPSLSPPTPPPARWSTWTRSRPGGPHPRRCRSY